MEEAAAFSCKPWTDGPIDVIKVSERAARRQSVHTSATMEKCMCNERAAVFHMEFGENAVTMAAQIMMEERVFRRKR